MQEKEKLPWNEIFDKYKDCFIAIDNETADLEPNGMIKAGIVVWAIPWQNTLEIVKQREKDMEDKHFFYRYIDLGRRYADARFEKEELH